MEVVVLHLAELQLILVFFVVETEDFVDVLTGTFVSDFLNQLANGNGGIIHRYFSKRNIINSPFSL